MARYKVKLMAQFHVSYVKYKNYIYLQYLSGSPRQNRLPPEFVTSLDRYQLVLAVDVKKTVSVSYT